MKKAKLKICTASKKDQSHSFTHDVDAPVYGFKDVKKSTSNTDEGTKSIAPQADLLVIVELEDFESSFDMALYSKVLPEIEFALAFLANGGDPKHVPFISPLEDFFDSDMWKTGSDFPADSNDSVICQPTDAGAEIGRSTNSNH